MKRVKVILAVAVTSVILVVQARSGFAGVNVDVNIGIPPPPVVAFPGPPEVVVVPGSHVYYVPAATEYDMYRYGRYWYINQGGYWYRARTYGGPFRIVAYQSVPQPLVVVPVEFRHHPPHPHGGPPGHFKHFRPGHGRGRGHGKHGD
jgi:hypothetical protein